ncbi:cytochrome P450 [Trichoderma sp. SZMC 28012]
MAIEQWNIGLGRACLIAFASLCIFVFAKTLCNVFLHPLRSYPGPWLSHATRLHYVYHQLIGDLPYKVKEWHDTYGEVVRIAPDELSYNSSAAYRDVHSWRTKEMRSGMEKDTTWYSQSINSVPVIVTAENDDHIRLRGILAHAFADRALARQEPLITSYVDLLIQKLKEHSDRPQLDLLPWLTSAAMDVILDLSFGKSLRCLEGTVEGELHPWVSMVSGHVKQGLYIQAWRRLPAWLSRNILVNLILAWLGREWKKQFDITTQMARQRIDAGTDREDFVSHLLRENNQKTGMTVPELEITSSILMTAGSDTNATLLCGCLYYAMRDRAVWNRLANEIRSSFSKESDLTFLSLQKLPFLNAVIEEALRLFVVVPSTFPRRTPRDGVTIIGKFVPGDYAVGINGYAAALCEANFTRANEFHPERWLGDARFARDDKKAHQPFSTGPRNCLGKNMAWAFARSTIARFIWNFDAELVPECMGWGVKQEIFVMFVKKPLIVKLQLVAH